MDNPQGQLTIFDYWRVVWRGRWSILAMAAIAAVVAFGLALRQPKIYTAKATILAPKELASQSLGASFGAIFLGGGGGGQGGREGGGLTLPGISLDLPSLSTNQDVFVALLKSRTMREEVLAELTKSWGPSVGSMVESVKPDTTEKGIIGIGVDAHDPKLAADLANYYFSYLERMLERYADQATRRREKFYAVQLERAAKEVEVSEAAVLKFQSENRFLALDTPTKREVDTVAMVRGQILALELQLETLRLRFTDQHPQMVEVKKQIAELKQQYSKSLFGGAMDLPPESPTVKGRRQEFFVPAAKMTPVQFAFLKLYRNLKIQEAFYTVALQALQQIKYAGGFSGPGVEVLDRAIPPGGPSGSGIWRKVSIAAAAGLVVGILLSFVFEYLMRVREQERLTRSAPPARRKRPDDGSERPIIPERRRVSTVESESDAVRRALLTPSGRGD